jgi:hypothetical protein
MDRGERRAKKATIRLRLTREFERWADDRRTGPYALSEEYIERYRRRLFRDEGGTRPKLWPYFGRCTCERCIDDKQYTARRESARMDAEHAAWLAGKDE